jgi:predicted transglutaminase-like protease
LQINNIQLLRLNSTVFAVIREIEDFVFVFYTDWIQTLDFCSNYLSLRSRHLYLMKCRWSYIGIIFFLYELSFSSIYFVLTSFLLHNLLRPKGVQALLLKSRFES